MKKIVHLLLVVAIFAAGFVGTLWYQAHQAGKGLLTVFVPKVECDLAEEICRGRMRAQAELFRGAGDEAEARRVYRRLALADDVVAAFQLGWLHEEAYLARKGRLPLTTTPLADAETYASGSPTGDAWRQILAGWDTPAALADAAERDRALAHLWYRHAADAGFAPALNNIASMYQFGELGPVDEDRALSLYRRAAVMRNPVAAANHDIILSHRSALGARTCTIVPDMPVFTYRNVDEPEVRFDSILGRTRVRGGNPILPMMRFFRDPEHFAAGVRADVGRLPPGVYDDPPVELVIRELSKGYSQFVDIRAQGRNPDGSVDSRLVNCNFRPGPGLEAQ
jgi:hypothetical protein